MLEKKCCIKDCGKDALFGRGVNLSRGIAGRWLCWPHYKEKLARERAEAPAPAQKAAPK